ncbi:hypothetical protein ACOLZ1_002134, partial [Vibrio fluvialis]
MIELTSQNSEWGKSGLQLLNGKCFSSYSSTNAANFSNSPPSGVPGLTAAYRNHIRFKPMHNCLLIFLIYNF